ncbi:GNAT family N-acetyltransferase [Curtobacterium sp. 20TX0008]|uniref:GNAT family N-acetyltransferase n=1 Tax=Curtobacterium sp. 20TX0008 TaxID=3022018 RepID=UPI00232AE271|nr:GNAT family N-acetyltransferase [Curtobacterium sp. 20TX0008]MDB6427545.1 GNAT family N-acetyltransferase [Curtobacterium sp. 20TX0008]
MPLAEPTPVRVGPDDVDEVHAFLSACDLTVAGLSDPGVRLWALRGAGGAVVGTTGYETGPDGRHALLRSVAVGPALRGSGRGAALARFAMAEATAGGARRAWLFSRRSGPFWQGLGFAPADRAELATVLAGTTQVELFRATGQLVHEVAWSRLLVPPVPVP